MLAGIGGRTVAEAKRNVSWGEFQAWMKYREAHGALSSHHRLEQGFALVAQTVASTIPRKPGTRGAKLEDFLPKRRSGVGESISLDEAIKTWK